MAKLLLDAGCVSVNVKQPFKYTSGIYSPIYCDNRLLISDVKRRRKVLELWAKMIRAQKLSFDLVAGTAMAGIPHAAWISDLFSVPMIYVRPSSKEHGKKNKIEGTLKHGQTVLVVEDLCSTGGSAIATVEAIKEAKGVVKDVTSIFSYGLATAKENFENAHTAIHPLCTFSTLIGIAVDDKLLPKEDADVALEWAEDPQAWGEKHAPSA
ncbi:orotate phosphoribosyltransferase [Bdellovibrionota bacterium]